MLAEALAYALSLPATPPPFRGHLSGAIGLWARGRRQQHRAWRGHLSRTKSAIEGLLATMPRGGTVVVLGSGPLFDVPLAALSDRFREVRLVDRAHMFAARRAARAYPNASFIFRDLSAATASDPLAFLRQIDDLDWVISVNLLSQLAFGAPEGREREVVDAHLDGLAALRCWATLITDHRYDVFDRSGHVVESFDLLYGRPMPPPAESWHWEVAPFGEESRDTRRVHDVALYPDWRDVE
jgi:hypothetical protein